MKELTKDQEAALGKRKYFGYVVELYYRDVLQDVVAHPRRLLRNASQAPKGVPTREAAFFHNDATFWHKICPTYDDICAREWFAFPPSSW